MLVVVIAPVPMLLWQSWKTVRVRRTTLTLDLVRCVSTYLNADAMTFRSPEAQLSGFDYEAEMEVQARGSASDIRCFE
jgi:hypothetical protein